MASTISEAHGQEDRIDLFERLKTATESEWRDYTRHEFVIALGDGSLPLASFQDYLAQDYLFLLQFARANALAAYKSRDLAAMQRASDALSTTIDETRLHIGLAERWGISPADLDRTPERQATVAYTRYVLDTAVAGDLLDLQVALSPCTIGYAEIGNALAPVLEQEPDHPYREWIATYAGEDYQAAARASAAHLDALSKGLLTERRLAELTEIFRKATNLETAFWQQAFELH